MCCTYNIWWICDVDICGVLIVADTRTHKCTRVDPFRMKLILTIFNRHDRNFEQLKFSTTKPRQTKFTICILIYKYLIGKQSCFWQEKKILCLSLVFWKYSRCCFLYFDSIFDKSNDINIGFVLAITFWGCRKGSRYLPLGILFLVRAHRSNSPLMHSGVHYWYNPHIA